MADQSLFCPFCGAQQIKADARFCHACGRALPARPVPVVTPVTPLVARRRPNWLWLLPLILAIAVIAAAAVAWQRGLLDLGSSRQAAWTPVSVSAGSPRALVSPGAPGGASETALSTVAADGAVSRTARSSPRDLPSAVPAMPPPPATATPPITAPLPTATPVPPPTAIVARLEIVMESDLPSESCVTQDQSATVRQILEHRLHYLRIPGAQVELQAQGCLIHVVVGLPLVDNPDLVANTLKSTGQLEFVEIGSADNPQYPKIVQGVYVRTTNNYAWPNSETLGVTPFPYPDVVFKTVMTGRELKDAFVQLDRYNTPFIGFELADEGAKILAEYTAQHVGDILAITLDNVVLSAPRISSAIPDGRGEITGRFTWEEASNVVAQILSGSMPVPMKVIQLQVISAGD